MKDQITRILDMVEQGKISSEEGVNLIGAINKTDNEVKEKNEIIAVNEKEEVSLDLPAESENNESVNFDEKMFKIKVNSHEGDRVNITLPIQIVKGMIKACGKIPNVNVDGMEGIDSKEMMDSVCAAIDSGMIGKIVDVQSKEGDTVEIVIE